MAKKYGRKVRRSKNLYKKKKSGFRKAVEFVVFGALVLGLVFVGYVVTDTLVNYTPSEESEIPVVNPEPDGSQTADGLTPESTEEPQPVETVPSQESVQAGNAVYAPANVLANSAALSAYIELARNDGFDSIVFEMKDDEGRLLYSSSIEDVADDSQIIAGTLTAKQIADASTAAGLRPVARINTLKDHIAPLKFHDISYPGWLDNRAEAGGRRWVNPFLEGSRVYHAQIAAELIEAGFSGVILANTIFPAFRGIDFEILPPHMTNPETRFIALGEFVNAISHSTADSGVFLEMSVGCFVDGNPRGTAEVLRNGGDSIDVAGIVLVFSRDDFSVNSADIVGQALTMVKAHSRGLEIIPLLDGAGLSESDIAEIAQAFESNNFENYMIRN
jgi:hypothetical protein